MIHLSIDDNHHRRLPFYLAMEEWAAAKLPAVDYFFTWQVSPTVIIGRNQRIDTEVNLDYCRENSIEVYRRKSGGGCVFADSHNIMFSYITPGEHVTTTFSRYTGMIAAMLRSLGLDATATGRNDILIDGRKVSGNSFYHLPGRSIVHGTMLYDTDFHHMANAITPSRSKLESKQVQSVASRITVLREHIGISLEEFRDFAISHLTDSEIILTPDQIPEIEHIEQTYYRPEWIFGRRNNTSLQITRRIEGVGEITANLNISGGHIADISLDGDFFTLTDLDSTLLSLLKGASFSAAGIRQAIGSTEVGSVIAGLETEEFINFLTQ